MKKHEQHEKRRLYARNQSSNAKQWARTNLYLCECGAVLEQQEVEVKVARKSEDLGNE